MKKVIKYILGALMVPVLFSSCLKDKEKIGPDADGAVENIIEFKNTSAPASDKNSPIALFNNMYDLQPKTDLKIQVQIAGVYNPKSDVKVVLELDNSLLEKYNEANETEYVAMNPTNYTLPSLEITIKKGERIGEILMPIFPDKFDFDNEYALGFKIKTVSEGVISGNFGSIIMAIGAKNQYDGVYNYQTSAITSLVPNANKTVELLTMSPTRLKLSPGLLATYSNEVYYTIDPVTNAITVECPSLGVQTPQDPRSKYDPATKTLKVYWKQGNGGRTFEETIKFTRPRG